MGKFADAASQHANLDQRGDGHCVVGRWATDNLQDEADLIEFVRLANRHKWELIIRLSGHELRQKSLTQHVHGACVCLASDPTRDCCSSCLNDRERNAS